MRRRWGRPVGGAHDRPDLGHHGSRRRGQRVARLPAASGLRGNVADHGAAAASGSKLQIQAGDSFFAPTCQTGVQAGTVTLVVHNSGQILHNLSVPGQGVDKDVVPGQTITVQVKIGGKALPFFCKYHRTSGMVGSLLPQG